MDYLKTREDVTNLFDEQGVSITEDAIDPLLEFIQQIDADKDYITNTIDAFVANHNLKEFDYKSIMDLISNIKMEKKPKVATSSSEKQFGGRMSAPTTPLKKPRISGPSTFVTPSSGRVMSVSDSPSTRHTQSPKTWPTPQKSDEFKSRKQHNVVKMSFGEPDDSLCDTSAPVATSAQCSLDDSTGEQNTQARYLDVDEQKEILREAIINARNQMNEAYGKTFTSITYENDTTVSVCGKIYFDSHSSTILKDSDIFLYDENESKVSLLLDDVPTFALFPGAVVGVEGEMSNRRIKVSKLYPGFPIHFSSPQTQEPCTETLSIWIARGPFSSRDDDAYEQLDEFVSLIMEAKPSLVILCGPFVPESSNALAYGSTELFKSEIWTRLMKSSISVVMIPSLDDTVAFPVFPQCPYERSGRTTKNVVCAGNPSVLEVNGIKIGVTNCDVLMDIMNNCYMRQESNSDKQQLFSTQLLQQRSLYPLYPSQGIPLDTSRLPLLAMKEIPDILVVATEKMRFAKEAEGVLLVCPGPLALGNGAGTYARITVYPLKSDNTNVGSAVSRGITKRCKVDIVNI